MPFHSKPMRKRRWGTTFADLVTQLKKHASACHATAGGKLCGSGTVQPMTKPKPMSDRLMGFGP
jgi:hypothetical protein